MEKKYEVVEDFDFNGSIPLKSGEIILLLTPESGEVLIAEGKIKEVTA